MSIFAQSLPAPTPKTKTIRWASLSLAAVITVAVVAQLFTFEDFPQVIVAMNLPFGEEFAGVRAALIVIIEVASLPFLLSMRLSPLARTISMVAGWMVAAAWLYVSAWTYGAGVNMGLLGATIPISATWWTLVFCLIVVAGTAWVAWGMWPGGKYKK